MNSLLLNNAWQKAVTASTPTLADSRDADPLRDSFDSNFDSSVRNFSESSISFIVALRLNAARYADWISSSGESPCSATRRSAQLWANSSVSSLLSMASDCGAVTVTARREQL